MAEIVSPQHALAVLYDLSQTIGGEVALEPLLTRTLQRLLYHTGFPFGVALAHAPLAPDDTKAITINAELSVVIGDRRLQQRKGESLKVPASLLSGTAPA
ncbi:MAG: hypothetical protein ABSF67_20310 [Roseiarcus sp.]